MQETLFKTVQEYLKKSQVEQALAYLQSHSTECQELPVFYILQAQIYLKLNEPELTFNCLVQAEAKGQRSEDLALLRAKAYLLSGDAEQAHKYSEIAYSHEPLNSEVYTVLFTSALRLEDDALAIQTIERAAATGCAFPSLPNLQEFLFDLPKDAAEFLVSLIVSTWPDKMQVGARFNQLARADIKIESKLLLDSAVLLAMAGDKEEAMNVVAPLQKRGAGFTQGIPNAGIKQYLSNIPSPEEYSRPLVTDDNSECVVSTDTGSGVTVLFFTGLADRAMADIQVIDAFISKLGYSAIYLRDFERTLYINGIKSLGRNLTETITQIKNLLERLNTRRVICVSSSGGSLGAVRWGIELKAEKIVCFSAATCVTSTFLESVKDPRGKVLVRRLHKFYSANEMDLLPLLEKAMIPRGIWMYYGESSPHDVPHAEYVAHVSGIHLCPLQGVAEHNSIAPMILANRFLDAIS